MSHADNLLRETLRAIEARRRLPEATYRLQFHRDFTFQDANRIVPYLRDLGITHVYASPYLKACPGSTHGYDIVDHSVLNPEIGSKEDYSEFIKTLHDHGLGQILDMVPNHMGIGSNDNLWWNDVLENGPASAYADYFDIAWDAPLRLEYKDKLVLPVLGDSFGHELESGRLQLAYLAGSFFVTYYDRRFPVDVGTYDQILEHRWDESGVVSPEAESTLGEYHSILTAIRNLPARYEQESARRAERQREKEIIKRRLVALVDSTPIVLDRIMATLSLFNGKPGEADSFNQLESLLNAQAYRLAFWRVASDEINYRRFFDVNELAALNMEREEVFQATHAFCLQLLRDGMVDGLRIDHPDGLFDPREYLRRLQYFYILECARQVLAEEPAFKGVAWEDISTELSPLVTESIATTSGRACDSPLYVLVEKILGHGESLREDWATHGTSGYDFLNLLNGLFVDAEQSDALTRSYRQWTEATEPYAEVVYLKKFLILQIALASELYLLAYQLDRLAQKGRWTRDFTLTTLRHALREVIACFPVYRSYISSGKVCSADRAHVALAVRRAKARNPSISASVFTFVRNVLLLEFPDANSVEYREEQLRLVGKFEQLTAPTTAKGVEDTAFYVYNRLLSVNEVGGDPGRLGTTVDDFHHVNSLRSTQWPRALSTLSTHDTKRSEDVRARLNVISEMPAAWAEALARWSQLNSLHRLRVDDEIVPDANTEYLLYQTLLGAWPLRVRSASSLTSFRERIQAYMLKAAHEAKVKSSWINPNEEYDQALQTFVARILSPDNAAFLEDFERFQRPLSNLGMLNSLAQTLLKITLPGVPDTYQGTEVWDFSLVDPDNRRPVDFEVRHKMLREVQQYQDRNSQDRIDFVRKLMGNMDDGRIKLFVTTEALRCRRQHAPLFSTGDYVPLKTAGACQEHVVAFARRCGDKVAIVAVPRLIRRLMPEGGLPLGPTTWRDTVVVLPDAWGVRTFQDVLSGAGQLFPAKSGLPALEASKLFAMLPVALWISVA